MPRIAKYDRQIALGRAVDLFWERGYFATSMKQIEQALDMRPGSLYATFGSKDGLFQEALDVYASRMAEELASHLRPYSSLLSGLKDYLRKLALSYAAGSPTPARACMIIKTLLELSSRENALQQQVNTILEKIEYRFSAIIEEARNRGEIAPDTDCRRLARLLQAQIMGLRSFAQREVPAHQVEQLADDMAHILDRYALTEHSKTPRAVL